MDNINWKDFKRKNQTTKAEQLPTISPTAPNSDIIHNKANTYQRATKPKLTWMIYVTPEINEKVANLMAKHRWNRTQALNYIFEVFFSDEKNY